MATENKKEDTGSANSQIESVPTVSQIEPHSHIPASTVSVNPKADILPLMQERKDTFPLCKRLRYRNKEKKSNKAELCECYACQKQRHRKKGH